MMLPRSGRPRASACAILAAVGRLCSTRVSGGSGSGGRHAQLQRLVSEAIFDGRPRAARVRVSATLQWWQQQRRHGGCFESAACMTKSRAGGAGSRVPDRSSRAVRSPHCGTGNARAPGGARAARYVRGSAARDSAGQPLARINVYVSCCVSCVPARDPSGWTDRGRPRRLYRAPARRLDEKRVSSLTLVHFIYVL